MKTVRLLLGLMVLGLVGCGGSGGGSSGADNDVAPVESLDQVDLSGTWEILVETKNYNKTTGDYLYSDFRARRIVFEDTAVGVHFRECMEDSDGNSYGVKSGGKLYLSMYEEGYAYLGNNRFDRIGPIEEYPAWWGMAAIQLYQTRTTLTKVSDDVLDDAGYLEFSEPFAINEQARVCVEQYYANLGQSRGVAIHARYGDYQLEFSVGSDTGWPVGEHVVTYTDEGNPAVRYAYLDVSPALLESTTGFDYIGATSGTIRIDESSADELSGSFDLVDDKDIMFKGSFSWNKHW